MAYIGEVFRYEESDTIEPFLCIDTEASVILFRFLQEMALDAGMSRTKDGGKSNLFELCRIYAEKSSWSLLDDTYCQLQLDPPACSDTWNSFQGLDMDILNRSCLNFWSDRGYFRDKDLDKVMRLMRYSKHKGTSHYNVSHLLALHLESTFKKYALKPVPQEPQLDPLSMIPFCVFKRRDKHPGTFDFSRVGCDLFKPMPTDAGICYTFNGRCRNRCKFLNIDSLSHRLVVGLLIKAIQTL